MQYRDPGRAGVKASGIGCNQFGGQGGNESHCISKENLHAPLFGVYSRQRPFFFRSKR